MYKDALSSNVKKKKSKEPSLSFTKQRSKSNPSRFYEKIKEHSENIKIDELL